VDVLSIEINMSEIRFPLFALVSIL
jgi:hypothetical protein